jgi:hypothetical protein
VGYYVYNKTGSNFGDGVFDTLFPMADVAMKALEAQYQATMPILTAAAEAAKASALKQVEDRATSSVTGLLLMVGAVGAGLWLLFGGKKRKARRNAGRIQHRSWRGKIRSGRRARRKTGRVVSKTTRRLHARLFRGPQK